MPMITKLYFLETKITDSGNSLIVKNEIPILDIAEEVCNSSIINEIIASPIITSENMMVGPDDNFAAISIDGFAEILYNSIINSALSEEVKNYLLSIATPWTVGIEVERYEALETMSN